MFLDTVEVVEELSGVDSPEEQAKSTRDNAPIKMKLSFTCWISLTPGACGPAYSITELEQTLQFKFRKGQETVIWGRKSTNASGSGRVM